MSLGYTAYMTTALSPAQVDGALAAGEAAARRAAPHAPAARRRPTTAVHPISQAMFDDSYGFRPTVAVAFHVAKWEDRERAELGPLAEIAGLLRAVAGDAYVDYSGLTPALLRRGGAATANAAWLAGRPWLRPRLSGLFGPACLVGHVPEPV